MKLGKVFLLFIAYITVNLGCLTRGHEANFSLNQKDSFLFKSVCII